MEIVIASVKVAKVHTFRVVELLEDGTESKQYYVLKRLKRLDQVGRFEDEITGLSEAFASNHPENY